MDAEVNRTTCKRRRPATSCDQCRRRKVKCDQNSPCAPCIRSKIERCSYHSFSNSHGLASETSGPVTGTTSGQRVKVLERVVSNGLRNFHQNKADVSTETIRKLEAKVRSLEQRLAEAIPEGNQNHTTPNLPGTYEKTRLLGRSHWINSCRDFQSLWNFKTKLESGQHPDIVLLMEKCKKLARKIKSQIPRQQPNDLRVMLPSKTTCDLLTKSYFRTFEPVYRIIHVPSFQKEYLQYWETPNSVNQGFVVKMLLMLAIGSCFRKDSDDFDILRSSAAQWIFAAQLWLNSPFAEKSRMTITGLQVHCLLLIARETNAIGGDLIWVPAGSLIRTARLMGLHRDPSHFPRMSNLHAQMRRRLWATILELALHASMNIGGHPLLSEALEDCDCMHPSNVNDDQLGGGDSSTPIIKPDDVYTDTSLQLAFTKTFPIRLEIANLLNSKPSEPTYEEALRLSTAYTSVFGAMTRELQQFQSDPQAQRPNHFHIEYFKLSHTRYIYALHDRFAAKASTNPAYYFSRKICLETSLTLMSPLFSHSTDLESPVRDSDTGHKEDKNQNDSNSDFYRLLVTGGGSYRSIPFHASLLLYFELANQLRESKNTMFISATDKLLRHELYQNLVNYRSLLLERVSAGETNIKGYIFSCAMLVELEMQQQEQQQQQQQQYHKEQQQETSSENLQNAMLQAMRTSLQKCHDILEKKADRQTQIQRSKQTDEIESDTAIPPTNPIQYCGDGFGQTQNLPTPNSTHQYSDLDPIFPSMTTEIQPDLDLDKNNMILTMNDSESEFFNFDFDLDFDFDFDFNFQ